MAEFDWNDIINAALAVYGIKQGQKPPKFYNAPPTPEDKWTTEAKHNLFGYASNYTDQFLKGLNSGNGLNPDSHLSTGAFGNPSFMGGIHVPTVDFGKMPTPSGTPSTAAPTKTPPPDSNGGDLGRDSGGGGFGGGGAGGGGFGGAGSGGIGGGAPSDPSNPGAGPSLGSVKAWWTNFQQEHPNWAALGTGVVGAALTATFGPAAALAFKILLGLGKEGGIDPNAIDPNTGQPYGSFAAGPQSKDSNPLNPSQSPDFGTPPDQGLPGFGNGPTYSGGQPIQPWDMTPGGGGGDDAYINWLKNQDFSVFNP